MASSPPRLESFISRDPTEVLQLTRPTLEAEQVKANVVLPTLQKCLQLQAQGVDLSDHLWIVIYIKESNGPRIFFVASCTNGYTGKYPIFLFTPIPYAQLVHNDHQGYIVPALTRLVDALRRNVQHKRVYSVFGPEHIAVMFSHLWTDHTRIRHLPVPYYHAKISFSTADTIARCDAPLPAFPNERIEIRPARLEDCTDIADLNYRFAEDSPPFILSRAQALREADILVRSEQVWVYNVWQRGQPAPRITSLVAFSRNTDKMATITKVYTHPDFRGQRRAEGLVRAVCKHLLFTLGKQYVVLFVGIENKAANVYKRVGFVGLDKDAPPVVGVDPWIEIGFDPKHVELGHW